MPTSLLMILAIGLLLLSPLRKIVKFLLRESPQPLRVGEIYDPTLASHYWRAVSTELPHAFRTPLLRALLCAAMLDASEHDKDPHAPQAATPKDLRAALRDAIEEMAKCPTAEVAKDVDDLVHRAWRVLADRPSSCHQLSEFRT